MSSRQNHRGQTCSVRPQHLERQFCLKILEEVKETLVNISLGLIFQFPPCLELLQQEAQGRATKSLPSLPALNENYQIGKRATLTNQISADKAASKKADQGGGNCHSCTRTVLRNKFTSLHAFSKAVSTMCKEASALVHEVCPNSQ